MDIKKTREQCPAAICFTAVLTEVTSGTQKLPNMSSFLRFRSFSLRTSGFRTGSARGHLDHGSSPRCRCSGCHPHTHIQT